MPRRTHWRCALALTIGALAVTAVLGVRAHALVEWGIRRWFTSTLDADPRWSGSFGELEVRFLDRRVDFTELEVTASEPNPALRRVYVPRGSIRPTLRSLFHGDIRLAGVAMHPRVEARRQLVPAKPLQLAPDPLVDFGLDVAVVDGTWVWSDAEAGPHDGGFSHEVRGVHGTVVGLGTLADDARLEVVGLSGEAVVRAGGAMDFWGATGDAVDLDFTIRNARPRALQGADFALFGMRLEEGSVDADMRFSFDRGPVDLRDPGCIEEEGLGAGCLRGEVVGTGLRIEGATVAPVTVDRLVLSVDGSVGEEPVELALEAWGLDLAIRRSEWTHPQGAPGRTLARVGDFEATRAALHDATFRVIDDSMDPPMQLEASDLELEALGLSSRGPGELHLTEGRLAGGVLEGTGTLDLSSWPPPTDLTGELSDLPLEQVSSTVERYVDAELFGGHGSVLGEVTVESTGDVTVDIELEAADARGRIAGWGVTAQSLSARVPGGWAEAREVRLSARDDGAIREVQAPKAVLVWDSRELAEHSHLNGSLTVSSPLVRARRVRAIPKTARPEFALTLDVRVHDGRIELDDDLVSPPTHIGMNGVEVSIRDFGTLPSRAHWTVAAELDRGGQIEGWADFDAFGGFTVEEGMNAHVDAVGLDLAELSDLSDSYLDFPPVAGRVDLALHVLRDGGYLDAQLTQASLETQALRLSGRAATLTLAWENGAGELGRELSGALHGWEVRVTSAEARDARAPRLPTLRIPELQVDDTTVLLQTPAAVMRVDDARVLVRDATTGAHGESGTIEVSGRLWDGALDADLTLSERGQHVEMALDDAELTDANPVLRELAGIDFSAGGLSIVAESHLAPETGLDGVAHLTLDDPDILQSDDWRNPIRGAREALLGLGTQVIADDGVTRLAVPLTGKPSDPELHWFDAYQDALFSGSR